jgi:hypothetical protein
LPLAFQGGDGAFGLGNLPLCFSAYLDKAFDLAIMCRGLHIMVNHASNSTWLFVADDA